MKISIEMITKIQKHAYNAYGKIVHTLGASVTESQAMKSMKVYRTFLANNGPIVLIKNPQNFVPELLEVGLKVVVDALLTNNKLSRTVFKHWNDIKHLPNFILDTIQLVSYLNTYTESNININVMDNGDINIITNPTVDLYQGMHFASEFTLVMSYDDYYNNILKLASMDTGLTDIEVAICGALISPDNVDVIQNREVLLEFYRSHQLVPLDAEEFIKYILFLTTGNTLIVKNNDLYAAIDACSFKYDFKYEEYFRIYIQAHETEDKALIKLSTIFYRYKKIYQHIKLQNKSPYTYETPYMSRIINRISKLAKRHHIPITQPWYMNILEQLDTTTINKLENLSTVRLGKLYTVLKYEQNLMDLDITYRPYLYRIRNGKSWIKIKDSDSVLDRSLVERTCLYIAMILSRRISHQDLLSKGIVNIALPKSGKQFAGNIPIGSYIDLSDIPYIFGIYWEDCNGKRVDLDLSMSNSSEKIGWDASRSNDSTLFSGDMTDSTNGATEMMYHRSTKNVWWSLGVNFYNADDFTSYGSNDSARNKTNGYTFKFFIAKSKELDKLSKDHIINTDDIIFESELSFHDITENLMIGDIIDNKFVFGGIALGNACTSHTKPEALEHIAKASISAKYMLGYINTTKTELLALIGD